MKSYPNTLIISEFPAWSWATGMSGKASRDLFLDKVELGEDLENYFPGLVDFLNPWNKSSHDQTKAEVEESWYSQPRVHPWK